MKKMKNLTKSNRLGRNDGEVLGNRTGTVEGNEGEEQGDRNRAMIVDLDEGERMVEWDGVEI